MANPRPDFGGHTLKGAGAAAARLFLACAACGLLAPPALADRLYLTNGVVLEVDEVWEDAQGVWFRRDRVTQQIDRARVRRIERAAREAAAPTTVEAAPADGVVKVKDAPPAPAAPHPVWIHLKGGARMEVDEASETAEGVWYRSANFTTFIDKERVERVEREPLVVAEAGGTAARSYRWTTGRPALDTLIRQNGARHGVDPYLIFLVMEHESHFNPGAVSPVGARGLMQLMPGTARRFGVRSVHDPAQNISGGTRYLKELLGMVGGRVDLVLAGYNAGEGAVIKYGGRVPPYRETRNYVKRIGARYGRTSAAAPAKEPGGAPPKTPGT